MNRIATTLIAGALACIGILPVPHAVASTHTVLYSFCTQTNCTDGATPTAGLTELGGKLYGTTYGGGAHSGGTLFMLDPGTGTETVLYSFGGSDGAHPSAGLINVGGVLYGTTSEGGTHDGGTVFGFDPNTGTQTVLYSFCSHPLCTDGRGPKADLINVNGTLYGTTAQGGHRGALSGLYGKCTYYGCGTVFSLDLNTGQQNVVYSFCARENCKDGQYPVGGVIAVKGMLYGATSQGGGGICFGSGCGMVFALDPQTRVQEVRHIFNNNNIDGFNPQSGLIDVNGTLYGTTYYGGAFHEGIVYSLKPKTGAEAVVYSFCTQSFCPDGASPSASLLDVNGVLYGTAFRGGTASETCNSAQCGSVFAVDPTAHSETTLHGFCTNETCLDGQEPQADLININGTFYGTTSAGGAGSGASCDSRYGCGTVFAITP